MMVEFSIVMSYHNRKTQLMRTLKSIELSEKVNDVEVIIVNDGSDDSHNLDGIENGFKFPIKVINIDKRDKWYSNPCVPYNIGFKNASGDVVIIQNPECLHVGDVIKYVDNHLGDDNYLSFSTYSLDNQKTNLLDKIKLKSGNIMKTIKPLIMEPHKVEGGNGWYNHSTIRNKGYHFCSAITKENLIDNLNGFDERYADGIAFDDDELIVRIKRLGLKIEIIDSPMVIHQWHTTGNSFKHTPLFGEKWEKNRKLLTDVTNNEKTYKVNNKNLTMKIFDCFKFFNELELLELRFMEYYDTVDYFVLVEANKTHTGIKKDYIFEDNKHLFEKYLDKVIHIKVDDMPPYTKGDIWTAENFQRNAIMRGLVSHAENGDKVIVSDIDEFPNVDVIKDNLNNPNWVTFNQKLYYYHVNCEQNCKWDGPIMANYGTFESTQELRNAARRGINRVPNGGWHYSFMGGAERVRLKVESIAESHLIIDNVGSVVEIKEKMENQKDLWNRSDGYAHKKIVDITDDKPKMMDVFLEKYPHFFFKNEEDV